MDQQSRPWRSVLYIPASRERALEKARTLAADAIIFDLEDAVAPAEKEVARARLAAALRHDHGPRARLVRINDLTSEWGLADVQAVAGLSCDGVVLPKVGRAADVDALAATLPELPIWPMMETPAGILNAAAIAGHPRVAGFILGTNDLGKEIGARFRPDRLPLVGALQTCLIAARAHGLVCIDGVYNAFGDAAGLRAECEQGRDLGFDGKTLIHPDQIAVANEVFAPSAEELDLARRQIEAYEAARAAGQGVAVVDGRIVENLHVATALAALAKAEAIAKLAAT